MALIYALLEGLPKSVHLGKIMKERMPCVWDEQTAPEYRSSDANASAAVRASDSLLDVSRACLMSQSWYSAKPGVEIRGRHDFLPSRAALKLEELLFKKYDGSRQEFLGSSFSKRIVEKESGLVSIQLLPCEHALCARYAASLFLELVPIVTSYRAAVTVAHVQGALDAAWPFKESPSGRLEWNGNPSERAAGRAQEGSEGILPHAKHGRSFAYSVSKAG